MLHSRSERRSRLISAPTNFAHVSHMGPGDGIRSQRLLDLPTTLETADDHHQQVSMRFTKHGILLHNTRYTITQYTANYYTITCTLLHNTRNTITQYTAHHYTIHGALLHNTRYIITHYTLHYYTLHATLLHCTHRLLSLFWN